MQTSNADDTCIDAHIAEFRRLLATAGHDFYDTHLKPGHALVAPLVRDGEFSTVTLDRIMAKRLSFFRLFPSLQSSETFKAALEKCDGQDETMVVVLIRKGVHVLNGWRRVGLLRAEDCAPLLSWASSSKTTSVYSLGEACNERVANTIRDTDEDLAHMLFDAERMKGGPGPLTTLIEGILPYDLPVPDQGTYNRLRKQCITALKENSRSSAVQKMDAQAAGNTAVNIATGFQQLAIDLMFGGDSKRFFNVVDKSEGMKIFLKQTNQSCTQYKKLRRTQKKLRVRKCGHCGKQTTKLLRCSICRRAFYCGQPCQRKDWSTHRKNCQKVRK